MKRVKKLEANKIFTIGVLEKCFAVVGDFNIRFIYEYNVKIYNGLNSSSKVSDDKIGKKFLLKLSSENPKSTELILNFRNLRYYNSCTRIRVEKNSTAFNL
ncbi:hypothetical protein H0I23_00890 [Cellulophaga sp. HaHaR_3_176]|uniref:hypothetical protein n=1 Tax=Cellulophaga sp. HaHaR_3_176 TaxID=1942464 RepID=UPI001C1F528F|nr:hypothetical protein [Cellulophaga sp. HaHaR_3_176]QWX84239.1 hypothetical protein H0I23_00890 [Cellulophaga sp. HaHaR_3_176]